MNHPNEPKDGFFANLGISKYFLIKNIKHDIPSSIVVFLVALPLCLGIALASGAPLFAGVLTGIIGGVLVGMISGSQLSVSGPAAGLTVIVLSAIQTLGSYEAFLLSIVLAGIFQIVLGAIKAGTIGNYFPSSVIEGMLAAIGIILILKQLPHAVGYDADYEGNETFNYSADDVLTSAWYSVSQHINEGALLICLASILILLVWPKLKAVNGIPAPLVVVVIGILAAWVFKSSSLALATDHLVSIPKVSSMGDFFGLFTHPNWSLIGQKSIWITAATIAIVASLETLLSLEAVDKIDPIKRVSPTNRELIAQGVGNMVSGILGGMPMTSVIVRSSANVNSGARTKVSAILHGSWLLVALLLLPNLINLIPLSCLAAILLVTGYKLANPSLFKKMWKYGFDQFVPFTVTLVAVVSTDLLTGVGVGMLVGVFYILRRNLRSPYFYTIEELDEQNVMRIRLAEEVSFLNKGAIQYLLTHLPGDSIVVIDGKNARYIDRDVLEIIENFAQHAHTKNIQVECIGIKESYTVPQLEELRYDVK